MASLAQLLAGKSLLVTGTTGFLAKAFVAKAVRDLPAIERLVLLIRASHRSGGRRVGAAERLQREVIGSSAFRRLRSELGSDFEARIARTIVALEGDLSKPDLGLAPADRDLIASLDAVVHSAATVSFDEELPTALAVNTFGPSHLMALCRRLGNVPLLHVSTAYSCGRVRGTVLEQPPSLTRAVIDDLEGRAEGTLDLDREIAGLREACQRLEEEAASPAMERELRRGRSDAALADARASWLHDRLVDLGMSRARERGWNDTYTYTKALGERLLVRDHGEVPACIVRPAIIESSLAEPEPGWIDGLRMADPLFAAYGKGILREIPADAEAVMDFIPADHVVNAMFAALGRLLEQGAPADGSVPVYHVATSASNPLHFRHLFELTRSYFLSHPLSGRDGRPVEPAWSILVDANRFARRMAWRRSALASLESGSRILPRRARRTARTRLARFRAQLERLEYYVKIYYPYCTFPARFDTTRTEALHAALSDEDRQRFPFDPKSFEWDAYIQDVHLPGLVRNVLREPGPEPIAHSMVRSPDATAAGRTLFDLLAGSARDHAGRVALQVKRDGAWHRLTYGELHDRALAAAAALRRSGVNAGDRVILQSENRPEWPVAYFAIAALGATAVPLDFQTPAARVAEVGRRVGARLAVVSRRCADQIGGEVGIPVHDLASIAGNHASAPVPPDLPVPTSPETPASILFTSGTTIDPKGVVLPHRAFLANVDAIREVLAPTPDDRVVSVLPLHHAFEFTAGLLTPLSAGSTITYVDGLSSDAVLGTLAETKATFLLGVPRLYELMLAGIERQVDSLSPGAGVAFGALRGTSRAFNAVGVKAGRALLSPVHARFGGHVRAFVSGGAALPPRVHDEFHALGFTLLEGYGLTETAPVLTVNPPSRSRAGSVGRPLPGVEIRVHAPGPDGVGEIVARGANVMSGYLDDPEATARVLRDGWFHTGDLGRFDADGYLHVTGRLKDLIVTGAGKNVYPDEVEAVLQGLPGAREACVVGVRSRNGAGEEVHLVVVPEQPGPAALDAIRREVATRCEALPSHQRIQAVHAWDEDLPKTPLMKVRRGVVREQLEERLGGRPRAKGRKTEADPAAREALRLLARLTRQPLDSLRPEQSLAYDLGVDSLMRVEIVSALEAQAGTEIADEVAQALVTVGDLADLARSLTPQSSPGRARRARDPKPAGNGRGDAGFLSRGAAPVVRALWPCFYERYLGLSVAGLENLPKRGPYIVAANHQSHLDAGAVLVALGDEARRLHVVAARDYFFDTPWKSAFFSELLNAIPFDRQGDFTEGLAACRAALTAGDPLLIFPEGTRSPDGLLQPFKAGLGVLAVELGIPVVPARIDGTHEALPKGGRVPRRRPVRVTFGAPIQPDAFARADALAYERYRDVVEAVRHSIALLGDPPTASA